MSHSSNQIAVEYGSVADRPIEYLTENGFSIMRLSEIDESIPAVGTTHRFLVRDPDGFELEITVDIATRSFGWSTALTGSTGPDGGFFKGPVVSPGVIGLTPGQNLLIFATIFTFDR